MKAQTYKHLKTVFVYDKYHQAWFEVVPILKPDQDKGTAISLFWFARLYGQSDRGRPNGQGNRGVIWAHCQEVTEQMNACPVMPQWEWIEGCGWVRQKLTLGVSPPMDVDR